MKAYEIGEPTITRITLTGGGFIASITGRIVSVRRKRDARSKAHTRPPNQAGAED